MLDFPSSPNVGDTYTGPSGQVWVWTGSQWTFATATDTFLPLTGGTLTGPLILFEDAVDPLEAVPLQQLDAEVTAAVSGYLPLSGGTLTGNLNGTTATFSGTLQSNTQIGVPNAFVVNSGGLQCNVGAVFAADVATYGDLFIGTSGGFYLEDASASQSIRILNWSPQWYDAWNVATGQRTWMSPAGALMWLDGGGNLSVLSSVTANSLIAASTIQGPNVVATGVMYISPTTNQYYLNIDGAGNRVINFTSDGWHLVWQASSGNFIYYNNTGTPLWYVDAAGSCHIAGTYVGGSGSFTGTVSASGAINAGTDMTCNTSFANVGIQFNSQPNGNHSYSFLWEFQVAGLASINVDGAVQYPLQTACDERLKLDIMPSTFDGLDAVLKTPLFKYRWKDHSRPGFPSDDEDKAGELIPVGFVAQRTLDAFPGAVIVPPEVTLDRHVANEEPGCLGCLWTVDDKVLIAAAYMAIKQLHNRIRTLEVA